MIDFSLSQVVQRHRHFRPGRAHAPDVSLFGFQVTHCRPLWFCVRYFVFGSAILFLGHGVSYFFLFQPFSFCFSHFLSVPAHFVSVSAILFLCPPFCFCVHHFASVSAILFLCPPFCSYVRHFVFGAWGQPFSFCVSHFLSVSAQFVSVSPTLFLCPPFWFPVYHFAASDCRCFPSCSYSISSFLSKIQFISLKARFPSRGIAIFPCLQVFFICNVHFIYMFSVSCLRSFWFLRFFIFTQ